MLYISFKAPGQQITTELHQCVCDLLACGTYTNKEVAKLADLGQNVVKAIDKERLLELYTTPEGKLVRPEKNVRFLVIDEFKFHNGHGYATHISDMETGRRCLTGAGDPHREQSVQSGRLHPESRI